MPKHSTQKPCFLKLSVALLCSGVTAQFLRLEWLLILWLSVKTSPPPWSFLGIPAAVWNWHSKHHSSACTHWKVSLPLFSMSSQGRAPLGRNHGADITGCLARGPALSIQWPSVFLEREEEEGHRPLMLIHVWSYSRWALFPPQSLNILEVPKLMHLSHGHAITNWKLSVPSSSCWHLPAYPTWVPGHFTFSVNHYTL